MSIDPLSRFQQWKLCDSESLKSAGDNTVLYTLYIQQHPAGIHKCPSIFLSSLQKSFTTFKIEWIMREKKKNKKISRHCQREMCDEIRIFLLLLVFHSSVNIYNMTASALLVQSSSETWFFRFQKKHSILYTHTI
jgi:hypothetical protein